MGKKQKKKKICFEGMNIRRLSILLPAFLPACVHTQGTAWIHTTDALQALHR
jgi:hypothetical protein